MSISLRLCFAIVVLGFSIVIVGCQSQETSTPAPVIPTSTIAVPTETVAALEPSSTTAPTETPLPTNTPPPTAIPIPWTGPELGPMNAADLEEKIFWGLGAPAEVEYSDAYDVLVVRTADGLFLYNASALVPFAHIPGNQVVQLSEINRLLATTRAASSTDDRPESPEEVPAEMGEIRLWNPEDGSLLRTIKYNVDFPRYYDEDFDLSGYAGVHALAFSYDGGLLAAGYGDTRIAVWDTQTWEQIALLESNVTNVPSFMAFSPDTQYLAAASFQSTVEDTTLAPRLQLWDVAGEKLASYLPNPGRISDEPFSSDSEHIVMGKDQKVHVLNLPDFRPEVSFAAGSGILPEVKFSHEDTHVIVDDEIVRRLPDGRRLDAGEETAFLESEGYSVSGLQAGLPDVDQFADLGHLPPWSGVRILGEQEFVVWGTDQNRLFTLKMPEEEYQSFEFPKEPLESGVKIELAPDGSEFAVCLKDELVFLDYETGEWRSGDRCKNPGLLEYLEDGSRLLRAGPLMLDQIDPQSGSTVGNLIGHSLEAVALEASDDGRLLASSTNVVREGAEVIVWQLDPVDLWQNWRINSNEANPMNALAFSPDGSILAIGGSDNLVKLYRVGDGWQLSNIPSGQACSMDFSPNGSLVAIGTCTGQLVLADVGSGDVVFEVDAHNGAVTALEFTPDGGGVLTTGVDGMVQLFGVEN